MDLIINLKGPVLNYGLLNPMSVSLLSINPILSTLEILIMGAF
jgi:hypothetical protein